MNGEHSKPEARTKETLHGNCRALNCYWREDEDGNWHTGCGQIFTLADGTPRDNRMRYCYHCGHRLRQRSFRYGR